MTPSPPSRYEQLTPEEAARVDALCDDFEQAWKGTQTGSPLPSLASYLGRCGERARGVLADELVALDRACRNRYGIPLPLHDEPKPVEPEDPAAALTYFMPRDARTPQPRPASWPNLPGLELVEVLGSGGMGVVFKARQRTLGRDVAVKLLRDAHLEDSERHERFLQEARAVARLQHPHLVQLYEFGELPGTAGATSQPYLVLEYISGGSLADLLRDSPLPPAEAARLVETLADAIHYAHQQGVVHRDLKPANVLLQKDEGGRMKDEEATRVGSSSSFILHRSSFLPKVTDFGLAKFLTGSDLTKTGDVLGTPSYMAPEQAAGKPGTITAAVDVYGLGAILYEALTGRPPFMSETAMMTLFHVQLQEPVPPRRLQPTVPRDLDTICLKCLRKEPGRRYATAQLLADDLRRFRAGESIRARPVGTGERVVRWCRRKPIVAGLLAALALVFLAGLAGVLWQWHRAEQNATAFQAQRDTARRQKDRAEHHLRTVRERVEKLSRLGRDQLECPGQYQTGKAVLEEALAFYQALLPEEGADPGVRWEAAQLYSQVGSIEHTLGHWGKALEAYRMQTALLNGLLTEEPGNRKYLYQLATSYRVQGNVLRDLDRVGEAREAYDQAVRFYEQFLREAPDDREAPVKLANTLVNKATLYSSRDQPEEKEALYQRSLEHLRAVVKASPNDSFNKFELALGLDDQGELLLATGRSRQAEEVIREALTIRQAVRDSGWKKGYIELYLARSHANVGSVLAAAGRMGEAERSYQEALTLLDRTSRDYPGSAPLATGSAQALAGLADVIKQTSRSREAEELRRQVIRQYERLRTDFPDDPQHRRNLVVNYLKLVSLLWELGRQSEAAEPLRKALELDPEDPAVNDERAWFLATCPEPRLRDGAAAVRFATKAVAARPQRGSYQTTLGVAHYRKGDDRAAITALEEAIKLRPGGSSADGFFLAQACWRLGQRDQARAWFQRAVEWMDKRAPQDEELLRFRKEAKALLAEAGKPESPRR
jgi:tetratricopeptide (TPR) repeat protein